MKIFNRLWSKSGAFASLFRLGNSIPHCLLALFAFDKYVLRNTCIRILKKNVTLLEMKGFISDPNW